jgi:UDPglucose 6-dehydrogenase
MNATLRPRLTVIGTGYLGATHAICMAMMGYEVIGVDVDTSKIETLNAGRVPFFEPGLPELLTKALESGRLRFTTSYAEAADFGDVHFICVGTPQRKDSHAADLTYVDAAVTELARHLTRRALIVGKSTVPVGTANRLATLIHHTAPAGNQIELAWNPEFLREGFAVDDTMKPDRLVFGVTTPWSEHMLRAAFEPVLAHGVPVKVTDLPTAELVKVAANSFLATKISYINAMAEICEATGADVHDLAEALAYDERIGGKFLRPGLGFGGGCLPKDIRAFTHRAEELGVGQAVGFLREIDGINTRRRARTVDLVIELCDGHVTGKRIAALGAAFKPNSDDIRDAPALDVAATLARMGAHVTVFDPAAMNNARHVHPELSYGHNALDAAHNADVVVLLTEWTEFRQIDPAAMGAVTAARRIVDGRHALDPAQWRAAGWEYRALGRP